MLVDWILRVLNLINRLVDMTPASQDARNLRSTGACQALVGGIRNFLAWFFSWWRWLRSERTECVVREPTLPPTDKVMTSEVLLFLIILCSRAGLPMQRRGLANPVIIFLLGVNTNWVSSFFHYATSAFSCVISLTATVQGNKHFFFVLLHVCVHLSLLVIPGLFSCLVPIATRNRLPQRYHEA